MASVLGTIDSAGFEYWELPIRGDNVHLGHLDPADLLADAGAAQSLVIAARSHPRLKLLSAGFEIHRGSPLERELTLFNACLSVLQDLGAAFVTIFAFDDGAAPRMQRLEAMAEAASRAGLRLLVETHRRTATEVPEIAAELASCGYALTLDHSHYVSKDVPRQRMAPLRSHAHLLQVRGCASGQVECPVQTHDEAQAAKDWLQWLTSMAPSDAPLVIEHIDRNRDWWPSIKRWQQLARELA